VKNRNMDPCGVTLIYFRKSQNKQSPIIYFVRKNIPRRSQPTQAAASLHLNMLASAVRNPRFEKKKKNQN
jgi:hypothetical protein